MPEIINSLSAYDLLIITLIVLGAIRLSVRRKG